MPFHPRDPLSRSDEQAKQLFDRFGAVADGFTAEHVIVAAANVIINALRQGHPSRAGAERAWDEWMGRAKGQLMECYDSAGRKKGIYPYHQTIHVPHIDLRRKS